MASDLIFVGQFVASKAGKTGLTVTVDVDRYTISDGSRSSLVTAGSATEGRRGLYHYRLAAADLSLYQYVATFITADSSVDQQEIAAIGLVVPDALTSSRLAPTTAGRTLDVSATGEAGVDWGNVGSPTSTVALTNTQINSVLGSIGGKVLGGGTDEIVGIGAQVASSGGLTAQQTRDAMLLAPTAGAPADGSIDDHLDDILEHTGITLPGLVSGLNGAVVEVVSAVSGGNITLYVADTWRFTVTSAALNLDGYEKLGLIVKANDRQADDDALLYLRTDTGLAKVNGAAPVSAANGSLTKTTTSFTGLVALAETQAVLSGDYRWWLKGFDTSPNPDEAITLAVGDCVLKSPGLRAVA